LRFDQYPAAEKRQWDSIVTRISNTLPADDSCLAQLGSLGIFSAKPLKQVSRSSSSL